MSGPRHLWSGDWESESAKTADDLAGMPGPVFDEPAAEPQPLTVASRRWTRKQLAIALATGVAAAAVTVGLAAALGGSNNTTHNKPAAHKLGAPANHSGNSGGSGLTAPGQSCQQTATGCTQTTTATPVISGPYADWMGMQIVTSPLGVVVDTVRLGSPADIAGFEPGDQITAVDTHIIGSVSQLRADTQGVKLGGDVTVAVQRQSLPLQLGSFPLTERPAIHP